MKHMFDVDVAKECGVKTAILLEHLNFWIAKNKANDTNFFDGFYWTYNSVKAFSELFPYLSKKQVRDTLDKMVKEGLIIKGNYNKSPYDRTCWYAITAKGEKLLNGVACSESSILPNGQMYSPEQSNENDEKGEPIPDINTDIKPGINTDRERIDYSRVINSYNEICKSFPRVTKLSGKRKEAIKARIHSNYTYEEIEEAFRKVEASSFLRGKNNRNWSPNFDWIIADGNLAKVLDGNYDDKKVEPNERQAEPDTQGAWSNKHGVVL